MVARIFENGVVRSSFSKIGGSKGQALPTLENKDFLNLFHVTPVELQGKRANVGKIRVKQKKDISVKLVARAGKNWALITGLLQISDRPWQVCFGRTQTIPPSLKCVVRLKAGRRSA